MAQSFHGGNKVMGLEKLNELDYSYILEEKLEW